MVTIRTLGVEPYEQTWIRMKQFTMERESTTPDEIWLLQHPHVYTQGQAGKAEHLLLNPNNIPIIQSDRGGQITYHGPGQLVVYFLIDIKRKKLGVRTLVQQLEKMIIEVLSHYDMQASTVCGAPGVYVDNKKIASIGLRVKNGCTYHGIAINIDMDLTPFSHINPCGFHQLEMAQIKDYVDTINLSMVQDTILEKCHQLFEN
jgi:lipoyl(octanoyl) transferase